MNISHVNEAIRTGCGDCVDALASGNTQRAVIVDGGLIGLEMSEALRMRGPDVTIVELLPRGKRRSSLATLPIDKPLVTFCKVSLRGYERGRGA